MRNSDGVVLTWGTPYKKGATPTPDHFWIGCGRDNMLNTRDTVIEEKRRCLYLAAALAIVEEQQKSLQEAEDEEKATPPRRSVGQGMVGQKTGVRTI